MTYDLRKHAISGNFSKFRQALELHEFISLVPIHYGLLLEAAISSGNADIVRLIVEKGKKELNEDFSKDCVRSAVNTACESGFLEVLEVLLSIKGVSGSRYFSRPFRDALFANHLKICKFLEDKIDRELFKEVICSANSLEAVLYCVDNGATHLNRPLLTASENGDMKMAKYCIEHGATDFENPMITAIYNNQEEIIKLLSTYFEEPEDFDNFLACAADAGNLNLCKFFISKGANDIQRAMECVNFHINSFDDTDPEMVQYSQVKKYLGNEMV